MWTYRADRDGAFAEPLFARLARHIEPRSAREVTAAMRPTDPRDRLIVALDAPEVAEAERLVAAIGDAARFYKIGMELAYGGGLALAPKLAASRQARVRRPQAARHPQYGRARDGADRAARGDLPHRARLSADDARGGRRREGLEPQAARRSAC